MFKKIMIWIGVIIISVIALFNIVGLIISAPTYDGPESGHFNGKAFQNLNGVEAKGFKDVLKWSFNRDQGEWNKIDELNTNPNIEEQITGNQVKITFVNHSTFLIQFNGINILTDPIWSERTSPVQFAGPKRFVPPGVEFDELPPIHYVIISHNHYDHLDANTVKRLVEKHNPKFFAPLGVSQFIKNLGAESSVDMDWWDEKELEGGVQLACVPAQHFSGRGTFDRDKTLWAGFVLKTEQDNIYFAGDTGYGEFFKQIGEKYGPFRLSIIPIGAYQPRWFMSPIHISPAEAVQVHEDVRSQQSIAMHFGTFPLADDGMDDPIHDLNKAITQHQLGENDFLVFNNGDSKTFDFNK